MKLELSILLEAINDRESHESYGSLLIHKLLSWKIIILTWEPFISYHSENNVVSKGPLNAVQGFVIRINVWEKCRENYWSEHYVHS